MRLQRRGSGRDAHRGGGRLQRVADVRRTGPLVARVDGPPVVGAGSGLREPVLVLGKCGTRRAGPPTVTVTTTTPVGSRVTSWPVSGACSAGSRQAVPGPGSSSTFAVTCSRRSADEAPDDASGRQRLSRPELETGGTGTGAPATGHKEVRLGGPGGPARSRKRLDPRASAGTFRIGCRRRGVQSGAGGPQAGIPWVGESTQRPTTSA